METAFFLQALNDNGGFLEDKKQTNKKQIVTVEKGLVGGGGEAFH